jgi:uroporphyrin-3 C-methyltransferase
MYAVYYHFNEVNLNLIALAEETERKIEWLQNNLTTVKKSADESENTIKIVQKTIDEFSHINKEDWAIKEANYLVTMANQNAQFAHNIPLAISLLKTADETLHPLSNPKYDLLRKALAEDITSLESIGLVDVTGIYMRLLAMSNKINELPLLNQLAGNQTQSVANLKDQTAPWWQRGLEETWQNLRQLIVIRYHSSGTLPLVPPGQQEFLYQNCYSEIMYATWGLLHQNSKIYGESLNQLSHWIKEYFMDTSPLVKSMLDDLQQLQAIDINPMVPAMTSPQAFSEFEKQGNK